MVQRQEFSLPSSDGVHQLHGALWLPAGEVRGVIQLVHGISEYILRYQPFAEFLSLHGWAVVGHDHLGHGGTAADPAEYGWFSDREGWSYITRDTRAVRIWAGARWPGLPYAILGHSMGSFVTRTYLIDYPGTVDGAILSGTGQEAAPLVALGKLIARLESRRLGPRGQSSLIHKLSLGAYNGKFSPARTTADWICRDEAVVDAYLADPLCNFYPSASMFGAMMGGLQYIAKPANLAKMDPATPVYFFAGDRDPVGSMGRGVEKVAAMFRRAGCADVSVKLYPGGRHEMLNETNRAQVYQDVLFWLDSRLPPH
jgi:alpha-beta hydrolase superfamily lysophospholipase